MRAHHLLCTVLFKGKGYSEQFTKEMTKIVDDLKNPLLEKQLILKTSPDAICKHCPNRMEDGKCALDKKDESGEKTINSLDEIVLQYFGLQQETPLNSRQVYKHVAETITEDFFDKTCSSCRWHEMGLCSYDEYKKCIGAFYN